MSPNTVTIIGAILMLVIILATTFKKLPLLVAFTVLPILTALILGYKPNELGDLLTKQVNSAMTSTGLLLMFSISFFTILSEAGMFDVIVNKLLKLAKGSALIVMIFTVLVATIGQLDGSLVTTYVITIPTLMPMYDKLKMDRKYLLLLTGLTTAALGNLPWGTTMNMMASIAGTDSFVMFHKSIPVAVILYVLILAFIVLSAVKMKKSVTGGDVEEVELAVAEDSNNAMRRPKLFWVNFILFLALMVCLIFLKAPTYAVFMVFFGLALLINYPNAKDQGAIIKKVAGTYLNPVMLIVSINVLIGVLSNTGILAGFVNAALSVIPGSMAKYTHLIFALLMVPIFRFIPYQVYTALYPFLIGIGEACGVPATMVMMPFATNLVLGTCCSPMVAQTYLGIGLAKLEMDDYVKFSMPICTVINIVCIVISVILGLM